MFWAVLIFTGWTCLAVKKTTQKWVYFFWALAIVLLVSSAMVSDAWHFIVFGLYSLEIWAIFIFGEEILPTALSPKINQFGSMVKSALASAKANSKIIVVILIAVVVAIITKCYIDAKRSEELISNYGKRSAIMGNFDKPLKPFDPLHPPDDAAPEINPTTSTIPSPPDSQQVSPLWDSYSKASKHDPSEK